MFAENRVPRRVVITGLGCVTPIGIGKDEFWAALKSGKSGISRIESFDTSEASVKIAGEIKNFDWESQLNPKDKKHVPRTVPLALAAARQALADAKIDPSTLSLEERRRFGVSIGTGGGGLAFTEQQYVYWLRGEAQKASVYTIASSTHGTLSSELSMVFKLHGVSHVISTGCTSSTDALAYASWHVALGKQDFMIAGGVDAPLALGILKGFELMNVLACDWNEDPARASRPFDKKRSGMVLGEGAWIFVLESLEGAISRKAKIYAEVLGYGSTCDAYHRVRLEENGVEPARAMMLAMQDAGVSVDEIDYINLHGTSTRLNDRIETKAIKIAFGKRAYEIPMSATKSQIGHPQGASGAAGVAATLLALNESIIPPTINLEEPDEDCDLDYVPQRARKHNVRLALCNCIGFGSKNSALILGKV